MCPTDASIADLHAPLTIDVHSHVFNGSDLQVKEFFAQAVVGQDDSELYLFSRAMGGILQALAWEAAPDAKEEIAALDAYELQLKACTPMDDPRGPVAAAYQEGYARGRSQLQKAEQVAAGVPESASVLGPTAAGLGLSAAIKDLPETVEAFEHQRFEGTGVLGSQPHLIGYVRFVLHHFYYRHVNALDYLATYSKGFPRKIDLLVASMVDYDWWLARGRSPKTSLSEQVDVMARISVVTRGRVHGFVPYCPFRELMTLDSSGVGDSFRLVKRAVEEGGFIGVKLYPPMGFAPWGNAQLDVWRGKPTLLPAASEPDFGKHLDLAMQRLFDWCLANDVPIMSHTNHSNGPYGDFKDLPSSKHWADAIARFPRLKVDFGHFGDTDIEDHAGDRSRSFVELMTKREGTAGQNLFADSGYFAGVLSNPTEMREVLKQLYAAAQDDVLKERLMYGTDWTMILPERNVDHYLAEFIEVMSKLEAEGVRAPSGGVSIGDAFFGLNAVEFLGLRQGKPARRRLEAFYDRHGLAEPDWMKKVG